MVTPAVVSPSIVAKTSSRPVATGVADRAAPTIPAAALDRTVLVTRLSPAMSDTGDISITSEPPASNPAAEATWVETSSFGKPNGRTRNVATATAVPPEPPAQSAPAHSPLSTSPDTTIPAPLPMASSARARSPAATRSSRRQPAASAISSRVMSGSMLGASRTPASMSRTLPPALSTHSRR